MSDVNQPHSAGVDYRVIPSIEQVRQRTAVRALEQDYGREAVVEALRLQADRLRDDLAAGREGAPADPAAAAEWIEREAGRHLRSFFAGSLRRVINATGVILHTNLGRAPLSRTAIDRIVDVAGGYSNLEFDVATGRRGRRDVHARDLIARLTGAEAAVVVNNNAAATMLMLSALASGREVIISRGELVEIGGGFRVPEVMEQSGAVLREVGTTNKTRIVDYERALSDRAALILRVHRSNFRIEGFTEQPSLAELVALGRRAGIPVVEDLGSGWLGEEALSPETRHEINRPGLFISRRNSGGGVLGDEPTVRGSIEAGMDLVCFSGDKLLGGPQAGLVVGKAAFVERLQRHPLMRALRVDKLTYAALEGTLLDYLAGRAAKAVPTIGMLLATADDIGTRATRLVQSVGSLKYADLEIADGASMVGGGSAPGLPIPTQLIVLRPKYADAGALEAALRTGTPPVIGRVEQNLVLLDLRTVQPSEESLLTEALRRLNDLLD